MAKVSNSIKFSTGGGGEITVVANYSALPDPTTVSGEFYWCSSSQGTSWLPGSLGGTYYNSGMYYSNGTTWEYINVPFQATQEEVNTGTNTDKFVTPNTFANADIWENINTDAIDRISVKLTEGISKGQAVYVSGADGTNILVAKASNNSESTSSKTIGLLESTGITNDQVKAITNGLLGGLNTNSATIGDPVWLGTSGNLLYGLSNKPVAPAHLVYIGVVTRVSATVGEILVKVQNGFELDELHDVNPDLSKATPLSSDSFLLFDTIDSLWKKLSISNFLNTHFNDGLFELVFHCAASNVGDNATLYVSGSNNLILSTTNNRFETAGITSSKLRATIFIYNTGTLGTSEDLSITLMNVTQGTEIALTTTAKTNSTSYNHQTGQLTFSITQGDNLAIRLNSTTIATNPTNVLFGIRVMQIK